MKFLQSQQNDNDAIQTNFWWFSLQQLVVVVLVLVLRHNSNASTATNNNHQNHSTYPTPESNVEGQTKKIRTLYDKRCTEKKRL